MKTAESDDFLSSFFHHLRTVPSSSRDMKNLFHFFNNPPVVGQRELETLSPAAYHRHDGLTSLLHKPSLDGFEVWRRLGDFWCLFLLRSLLLLLLLWFFLLCCCHCSCFPLTPLRSSLLARLVLSWLVFSWCGLLSGLFLLLVPLLSGSSCWLLSLALFWSCLWLLL